MVIWHLGIWASGKERIQLISSWCWNIYIAHPWYISSIAQTGIKAELFPLEWIKHPVWLLKRCSIVTRGVTFCPRVRRENLHSSVPLRFVHKWRHGHTHQLSSWWFFTSRSCCTFAGAKCIHMVWSSFLSFLSPVLLSTPKTVLCQIKITSLTFKAI